MTADGRKAAADGAFFEGMDAFAKGLSIDDNPNMRFSRNHAAWEGGYIHAAELRRKDGWCQVCGCRHHHPRH